MRAGAFSERCAEALNGIQHNAGRNALGVVSELNCVVDLLYVVAVLKFDYVPAKSVKLGADALAMGFPLTRFSIDEKIQYEKCANLKKGPVRRFFIVLADPVLCLYILYLSLSRPDIVTVG